MSPGRARGRRHCPHQPSTQHPGLGGSCHPSAALAKGAGGGDPGRVFQRQGASVSCLPLPFLEQAGISRGIAATRTQPGLSHCSLGALGILLDAQGKG